MASPANNNSSSSPPIPNRPNPKPRNSEVGDPLRRSFGGNPFPANSRVNIPSDLSRRNSFGGRENSRIESSNKENETKALPTPKCSKNFMSPTISAVSKINPSPRKKVLSDRNELSRSSEVKGLILEDTKSHSNARSCVSFSDVKHIIDIGEKKRFEGSHDMTVTDYDENEVHEKKGIVYSDPRFRISPRPSVPYTSPEFADREAAPLLPPYDPKKNYLSPRPQFLHYRPNPRIEKHFDECKQLEEVFISESSSSDTELSVNCEEQEEISSHEGAEAVVEEKEEVTEVVEQLEAESDEEMVCESIGETNQVPKQSGFRKFRFLGCLLALAMAYLLVSASFSGPNGLSVLKESPLYEFHIPKGITEFAKGNNLEQLSEKLWTLTESSLVYMDKLISRLGRGAEEYGPLKFHNLTYILEDNTVFQPLSVEINEEPLLEKSIGENNLEDGYDSEFEEEESGGEENSEVVSCETEDEQTEMKPGTEVESNEGEGNLEALSVEYIEEQKESEMNPEKNSDAASDSEPHQTKVETGSTKKVQEQLEEAEPEAIYIDQHDDVESTAINVHQHKENEVADAESGSEESFGEIAAETSDDHHPKLQQSEVAEAESGPEEGFGEIAAETSDDLHPKLQQSEVADAESKSEEGFGEIAAEASDDLHPEVKSFNKLMIVSSSTVLILLAGVAFLLAKKAKSVAASAPEPAPVTEKLNLSHVQVENPIKEKLSSLNVQAEEVEDRTSNSFHKKSSFISNNRDPKEYQSGVGGKKGNSSRNPRRESMASSASEYSVGSFSYGSFTTYEKIPIKSGDREEEMITPVRRSNRIRNHQL